MSLESVLNILGVVLAIAIPILGWWMARRNTYVYNWNRVLKAIHSIKLQLQEHAFEPDVILAYPKGGLIVADLLGHEFDNRIPICTVYTRRLTKGIRRQVHIDTRYANLQEMKGKKILLVDDVIQSGSTLQALVELLQSDYEIAENNIRIAVLGVHEGVTVVKPDFYVFKFIFGVHRPVLPWGEVPRD